MAGRLSNPLALAVLSLLYERPMHPYEMSTTLRERQKDASIKLNFGSLYSVVESLQKRGLIEAQETVREGRRPERTVYAITDSGTERMVDWLSDLLARPVKEYTQFEAALSLMPTLHPDEVVRLLEHRLTALNVQHQATSATLGSAGTAVPRLFLIESEFVQALLEAEIEFVRELLREIRSGELSGLAGWRRIHELRAAGRPPEEVEATLAEEFREEFGWLDDTSQN